jgi:signal transduction histidine kinase
MKIEQKIVLSITFNLGLILLIGLFSLQDLNQVLTKLRFTAIADELNASFLEMRLSEKNYFLYQDESALEAIRGNLALAQGSIDSASADIASAIGDDNLRTLKVYVGRYASAVEEVRASRLRDSAAQDRLRQEGRRLKEFSEAVTRAERDRVKGIISSSKRFFFYSFGAVILLALVVSHFISQKILRSLRAIEKVARAISAGNFDTVDGELPHDEMGAVMLAVNSMSGELKNREEALIQSKKLASIGILTAGVAHELTNPLNNISMIAQNYAEYYDRLTREQRIDLMAQVDGQAHRIEEIVRNLLDFSKPKEANLEVSDVNETIRTALRLIQNTLDISNIELRLALAERRPPGQRERHPIQHE